MNPPRLPYALIVGATLLGIPAPARASSRVDLYRVIRHHTPAPIARDQIKLERGYLRVQGVERKALADAITLRVPALKLQSFEDARPGVDDTPEVFIDVHPDSTSIAESSRTFAVTIVVSDGRAYDRQVEAPTDDDLPRLLANNIANLLLAIEAGTLKADRGNVPMPTVAKSCPPCPQPKPTTCPPEEPNSVDQPPPVEDGPPPPPVEFGVDLEVPVTLGLGDPDDADRFAAWGGQVGLLARLRQGALLGIHVRVGGRGEASGIRLLRTRVAVSAGYDLRRGSWSLAASLLGSVEPWRVLGQVASSDQPERLWGLALRLSPGLVWRPRDKKGPLSAIRVGPRLEVGSSAVFSDGPKTAQIIVQDGDIERGALRLGGVELSGGVYVTVWLAK